MFSYQYIISFGFPIMVPKGGLSDPYDPLDPSLNQLYSFGRQLRIHQIGSYIPTILTNLCSQPTLLANILIFLWQPVKEDNPPISFSGTAPRCIYLTSSLCVRTSIATFYGFTQKLICNVKMSVSTKPRQVWVTDIPSF